MRLIITPNNGNPTFTKMINYSIGDMVRLSDCYEELFVYRGYKGYKKELWGSENDGFNGLENEKYNTNVIVYEEFYKYLNLNGLYGNRWVVKNFTVSRYDEREVMVHIVDALGRNALVWYKSLKLLKKNPKKTKKTLLINQPKMVQE